MLYAEQFTLTFRHTRVMDYDGTEQYIAGEPISTSMIVEQDKIYDSGKNITEVEVEILDRLTAKLIEKLCKEQKYET